MLSVLRRILMIPMLILSVIAVNILILKRVLYTLEQDTITQVQVGLFHVILLPVKMKIRLALIFIPIVIIILYFTLIQQVSIVSVGLDNSTCRICKTYNITMSVLSVESVVALTSIIPIKCSSETCTSDVNSRCIMSCIVYYDLTADPDMCCCNKIRLALIFIPIVIIILYFTLIQQVIMLGLIFGMKLLTVGWWAVVDLER